MRVFLFLLVVFAFPLVGRAEENFEAQKTMMAQNLDQRIASLQKMKGCFQSASSHDAIKACRETHRTEMRSIEDSHIDAKIQKLQEKKARRGQKD